MDLHQGVFFYWIVLLARHALVYREESTQGAVRASQLEAQLVQAQLQALKMQLNPHFLFNTLNSISTLLLTNPLEAHKMVARLGDLLRMTLNNSGAGEITLDDELDFLACYLEIEHTRYRDRLTVAFDIDLETRSALVPNLFLQPIVENAIRHGIAPRPDPGRVRIRAERRNGHLQVEVQDDGPGLCIPNGGSTATRQFGIGLSNTRSRLNRMYGDDGRLELKNVPEGGLLVRLNLPFKTEIGH